MLRFSRAGVWWWRKPLVREDGKAVPAELAVLHREVGSNERGVWLNSRKAASGVVALQAYEKDGKQRFRTRREPLPLFVAAQLEAIYTDAQVAKGCPDLVIWRQDREELRLIEVKCPHWDELTAEQERFITAAAGRGVSTRVVEWEFVESAA